MLWSWELIFSYLIVSYLPEYIAISYYCVFLESMSSGTVDGSRDHLWMSTLLFLSHLILTRVGNNIELLVILALSMAQLDHPVAF